MRLVRKIATSLSDLVDDGFDRISKVIKDEAMHSLEKNLILSNKELAKENEKVKKRTAQRAKRKKLISESDKK